MEVQIMEAILERVKEVISEQLGIEDVESITLETTFIDDLGADSLDIVELIMALEEEFDMEIPEVEAEKIISVGDVVEYIHKTK
jgi:acyl carrier protein